MWEEFADETIFWNEPDRKLKRSCTGRSRSGTSYPDVQRRPVWGTRYRTGVPFPGSPEHWLYRHELQYQGRRKGSRSGCFLWQCHRCCQRFGAGIHHAGQIYRTHGTGFKKRPRKFERYRLYWPVYRKWRLCADHDPQHSRQGWNSACRRHRGRWKSLCQRNGLWRRRCLRFCEKQRRKSCCLQGESLQTDAGLPLHRFQYRPQQILCRRVKRQIFQAGLYGRLTYQREQYHQPDFPQSARQNERTGHLYYFLKGSIREWSLLLQTGQWFRCARSSGRTGLQRDSGWDAAAHPPRFQPYFRRFLHQLCFPLPSVLTGTPYGRLSENHVHTRWARRSDWIRRTL